MTIDIFYVFIIKINELLIIKFIGTVYDSSHVPCKCLHPCSNVVRSISGCCASNF